MQTRPRQQYGAWIPSIPSTGQLRFRLLVDGLQLGRPKHLDHGWMALRLEMVHL